MLTRSRRPSRRFRAAFRARSRFNPTRSPPPIRTAACGSTRSISRPARVAALGTGGNWDDEQPRWSPDGRRVAFKSNRGGSYNLYVMDADGRNVSRLTNHAGNDHDPTWLPDGQSMVFTSDRDRGVGRNDLYRLWLADGRVDRLTVYFEGIGDHAERLTGWQLGGLRRADVPIPNRTGPTRCTCWSWRRGQTWPFDVTAPGCWPNWSPTVNRSRMCGPAPTGRRASRWCRRSAPRRVMVPGESSRWHYYPDWSPDSRLLAMSVSPEHHDGENWDLAIADPSRAMPFQRLTTGSGNDRLPDWKPR